VVLREALSKQNSPFVKLLSYSNNKARDGLGQVFPQVNEVQLRNYRMFRQVSPEERSELVELYRSGKNTYELARQFGVHRVTVSRTLKQAGVEMRYQGLSAEQIAEAVNLYKAGNSLARIGEHFGVDHGTVWRQLRKRGVKMRDTHGRPT
jgi:IS30 family transposase